MSGNIFAQIPKSLSSELFTTLFDSKVLRIERIVSHGHASPEEFWYDQREAEWVIVVSGAARLRLEDGIHEMRPGDYIYLPPHAKHRVEWTTPDEPTVWLAIFHSADNESAST